MNCRKVGIGKLILVINILLGIIYYVALNQAHKSVNDMISSLKNNDTQYKNHNLNKVKQNQYNFPIDVPGTEGKMKLVSITTNETKNYVYYHIKLYYGKRENARILNNIKNDRQSFIKGLCTDSNFVKNILHEYSGVYIVLYDDYENQKDVAYFANNICD